MSERIASVPAAPRRRLTAPAAALARVRKELPGEPVVPVPSAVRQAHDKPVTEAAQPADQVKDLPFDPELAARRKERNERRNTLALVLRQRWPELFTTPFTPWAIGMHNQILEALECDLKDLRAVLSGWSHSRGTRRRCSPRGPGDAISTAPRLAR
jgi:hypothetical protein